MQNAATKETTMKNAKNALHCESCGSTDAEDLRYTDENEGYTNCCNELVCDGHAPRAHCQGCHPTPALDLNAVNAEIDRLIPKHDGGEIAERISKRHGISYYEATQLVIDRQCR